MMDGINFNQAHEICLFTIRKKIKRKIGKTGGVASKLVDTILVIQQIIGRCFQDILLRKS